MLVSWDSEAFYVCKHAREREKERERKRENERERERELEREREREREYSERLHNGHADSYNRRLSIHMRARALPYADL
jgi:hypothetical protein